MGARSSNTNRKGDRSQSLNRLFDGHAANFFNSHLNAGTIGPNQTAGPPVQVTGGDIDGLEPGNGYKYHVFTSSGSLVVASVEPTTSLEFIVVAGGGGGAQQHGGGGGAGGILHHPGYTLATGTYTVTVGPAGAAGAAAPNGGGSPAGTGGDSYFGLPGTPTAQWTASGGGGASNGGGPDSVGVDGGSGGGSGGYPAGSYAGGAATQSPQNGATGYGNAGMRRSAVGPAGCGGGGGGAGGSISPNPGPTSGNGGPGQPFSDLAADSLFPTMPTDWKTATGPTGLLGGGGGGGASDPPGGGPAGEAGPGGGGDGAPYGGGPGSAPAQGNPGYTNTGGGGGGAGGYGIPGGAGGTGIVIARYPVS